MRAAIGKVAVAALVVATGWAAVQANMTAAEVRQTRQEAPAQDWTPEETEKGPSKFDARVAAAGVTDCVETGRACQALAERAEIVVEWAQVHGVVQAQCQDVTQGWKEGFCRGASETDAQRSGLYDLAMKVRMETQ